MKLFSLLIAVCFVFVECIPVFAVDMNKELIEDIGNFTENVEKYDHIKLKINEEKDNYILKEEYEGLEQYLNENGVYDREIRECFSEEELEQLSSFKLSNMEVMTAYYIVIEDDEDQEDGDKIENQQMIRLTDGEVDLYIGEKYYGEKNNFKNKLEDRISSEKGKKKISDKLFEKIGLKTVDVYADDYNFSLGGGNETMLKKTLYVCRVSNDYVYLKVTCDWETMPVNRGMDYIEINLTNCMYLSGAPMPKGCISGMRYTFSQVADGYAGSPHEEEIECVNLERVYSNVIKNNQFRTTDKVIIIGINLTDDENYLKNNGNVYDKKVVEELVYINFYVKFISSDCTQIEINPVYTHTKKGYWTLNFSQISQLLVEVANGNIMSIVFTDDLGHKIAPQKVISGSPYYFVVTPYYK